MTPIIRTEIHDPYTSTYYDDSNGVQQVTLLAKGDYNGDQLEDMLLFIENSIQGASYTSQNAVILTRLGANTPLVLVKSLHVYVKNLLMTEARKQP